MFEWRRTLTKLKTTQMFFYRTSSVSWWSWSSERWEFKFQSFSLWNVLYTTRLFQTSFVEKLDWTRFIHSPSRLRCLLLSMQMICTKFQIKQMILVIAGELETYERLLTRRRMSRTFQNSYKAVSFLSSYESRIPLWRNQRTQGSYCNENERQFILSLNI